MEGGNKRGQKESKRVVQELVQWLGQTKEIGRLLNIQKRERLADCFRIYPRLLNRRDLASLHFNFQLAQSFMHTKTAAIQTARIFRR